MHTISIYTCSAVLYHGTKPVGAHAGSSDRIESQMVELGKVKGLTFSGESHDQKTIS